MTSKVDTLTRVQAAAHFTNLVEVFVDDFCAMSNNITKEHLTHFSRAMLHGIHSVFPPPESTGHDGPDPVSEKKLHEGEGKWEHTKEILGWIMDGANFTVHLPPKKCQKILDTISTMIRKNGVTLNDYQKIVGKLVHAAYGIAGGKGLLSPLYRVLQKAPPWVQITPTIKSALQDWKPLIRDLARNPTHVSLLVHQEPHIIQYTDACGLGAGGVVVGGKEDLHPIVWQYEWPEEVKRELITDKNPNGSLTINDLELAGILLGWLIIEIARVNLHHKHVGSFCDNTAAVSWARKMQSSKSVAAARLLRFLALRQRTRQASPLTSTYIPGELNELADICSRAFKEGKFFRAHKNLLAYFNSHFPLQKRSWREFYLPTAITSRVISCLLGEHVPMASLIKLPKRSVNIGATGVHTPKPAAQTHTWKESKTSHKQSSSLVLQQESGQEPMDLEKKLKSRALQMPSPRSPRPSNWLTNKVPSTKMRPHTSYQSSGVLKDSEE